MRRMLLPYLALLLVPVASGADTFDDGGTHDVDFPLSGNTSFVRNSTTVNMVAGGEVSEINVEDSSVLNFFAGSVVSAEANYMQTSEGAICGGTLNQLDIVGSATVEVNGGDFARGGVTIRFGFNSTGGKLTIQGGRFENTSTGGDDTVILLAPGTETEIRGGAFVGGHITTGNLTQLTIKGGDFSALELLDLFGGGILTIVGTDFQASQGGGPPVSVPFGPLAPGVVFNGALSGTLADGSPFPSI